MNKWNFRRLRVRDAVVIIAIILGLSVPLFLTNTCLFGSSERVSALLSAHFALSPDALTAGTMAAFCLVLALAMFVGDRILRRFLSQH